LTDGSTANLFPRPQAPCNAKISRPISALTPGDSCISLEGHLSNLTTEQHDNKSSEIPFHATTDFEAMLKPKLHGDHSYEPCTPPPCALQALTTCKMSTFRIDRYESISTLKICAPFAIPPFSSSNHYSWKAGAAVSTFDSNALLLIHIAPFQPRSSCIASNIGARRRQPLQ